MNITPELFWNAFSESLRKEIITTGDWKKKYFTDKEWTPFIMNVLAAIGKKPFGYHDNGISREYYRIDLGYFSFPDNTEYPKFEWDFDVAIEHENNGRLWFDELIKLAHISCGLKIIITYLENDHKVKFIEQQPMKKSLLAQRKYINQAAQWLFIIGPVSYEMENKDYFACAYDGKEFTVLPEKKILL
ncbi:MAG: hypothetical protein JXD23_02340 [Spirochaetales bacterium]|nr:hypothetical protein [Spirochaetales bacterium]